MNPRMKILGLILTLFAGCAPSDNEKMLGSHHVKIIPGSITTSSSQMTTDSGDSAGTRYEFSSGDTQLVINSEELMVNDQTYGTLNPGDSIEVDHGRVLVNGKELQGKQLTEEDKRRVAPSEETTGEVAGYPVTIRPGTVSSFKVSAFGKHSFTAGETEIVVKDDSLYVNDKSYGKLKKGDTITVEFGRVIVSGKQRPAKE